jgi:hypothetical protein
VDPVTAISEDKRLEGLKATSKLIENFEWIKQKVLFAGLSQTQKEMVNDVWPRCRAVRERCNPIPQRMGIVRSHCGVGVQEVGRHTEVLVLQLADPCRQAVKRVSEDKY